jgi:hypothetical protein
MARYLTAQKETLLGRYRTNTGMRSTGIVAMKSKAGLLILFISLLGKEGI